LCNLDDSAIDLAVDFKSVHKFRAVRTKLRLSGQGCETPTSFEPPKVLTGLTCWQELTRCGAAIRRKRHKRDRLRPNLLFYPSFTLPLVTLRYHLCIDIIVFLDLAIAAANMANDTATSPGSLLYRRDLFSSSELFSQKTAYAVLVILSISLPWKGFQRRKFYRDLVSKPLQPYYLPLKTSSARSSAQSSLWTSPIDDRSN
jgi:hypothetical protein